MKSVMFFSFFLLLLPGVAGGQVVDTAAVRREVDSLVQLNRKLVEQRKFEKALQVIDIAKRKAEEAFGKMSIAYSICTFDQAKTYHLYGRLLECEPLYLEAIDIRRKLLGNEHSDYILSLNHLAVLYSAKGDFVKSEPLFLEVKETRAKVLGKEHPLYALSLNNLASLYLQKGDYNSAESLLLEAKEIRARLLGREHEDYAVSLLNLGSLYINKFDFEKSEQMYLEAKEILAKKLGKEHRHYASSVFNLARLYAEISNYSLSEQLYIEAKNIREKSLGKEHPDYLTTLNNLANLYSILGKYEKSESIHLEVKKIRHKVLGRDHPDYAQSLNNIANLYFLIGDYDKSESLYLEAIDIQSIKPGKESLDYALSLNNLGNLYQEKVDFEKAELLYSTSRDIRAKIVGKKHPLYAQSLSNLAILYKRNGDYAKSESLYSEVVQITINTHKKEHSTYAEVLQNLGNLYLTVGDYSKAESSFKEAIEIYMKIFGNKHPSYSSIQGSFASLLQQTNRISESGKLLKTIDDLNCDRVRTASEYSSENQMLAYTRTFHKQTYQLLSFAQSYPISEITGSLYRNALFHKGFLLEIVNRRNHITHSDTAALRLDNLKKSYFRLISKEYAKPIAERDSARIAEWEEKANAIEKELVRTVAGYGDLIRQISWEEVKQQLRPGEAAVELVSYRYYTPEPTDSTMYAALILLPTDTAPHFIPLFEERQLQALLNRPGLGEELTVKGLYASNSELLNLLWTPLEPLLRDVKTIYYSPAGLLHRINPAALRDAGKQPLSAGREWVRVGSTRELVTGRLADRSFAHDQSASSTAAVWGGIRYDMDSTAFAAANPIDPAAEPLPEFQRKDGRFRYMVEDGTPELPGGTRGAGDEGWKPLAGSAREAGQVGELLQKAGFRTEVLSDYTASEERFKAVGQAAPSPRILHVATHGFAYPDPKKEPQRDFAGEEPVYKLQDDPMLRSGLLLAGANHYWANKRPLQNREDGVLVAYEVRDLNLRNTELAVLSACQTGLGDVVGSEGVYGLQRAFRIAGAKFLIVSLWQVPDEQTQELMRLFYENWVDKRESLRDAFNHAQATLREQEPNPYIWAGFVLIE